MAKYSSILLEIFSSLLLAVGSVEAETLSYDVNGVKFNMVYVEGGSFLMGSLKAGVNASEDDETPHKVVLSNFYMGETEVTQALWTAVMGRNPSYFRGDSLKPVERITWEEAQEFVSQLNRLTHETFSLPTEAEWEYAAKGGNRRDTFAYSGATNIEAVAVFGKNGLSVSRVGSDATNAVASKSANSLGIYDMSGNVYEYCEDWYYRAYSTETEVNPKGPEAGHFKVVRGGGWSSEAFYCRNSKRVYVSPKRKYSNVGMRLCLRK